MILGVDVTTVTIENLSGRPTNELLHIARESRAVSVLEIMIEHDDPLVRGALCENPQLPTSLIRRLKEDPSDHVKNKAALLQVPDVTDVVNDVRSGVLKD